MSTVYSESRSLISFGIEVLKWGLTTHSTGRAISWSFIENLSVAALSARLNSGIRPQMMMNTHIYKHFLINIINVAFILTLVNDRNVGAHLNTCSYTTFTPNYAASAAPLHRWRRFPVKVYFAGEGNFTEQDGTDVDLEPVVLDGLDQWVEVAGGKISYVLTDKRKDANIIIEWAQRSGSIKDDDDLAETDLGYYEETGIMFEATIVLYLWDEMSPSQVYDGLKKTATHEFAHALGMEGHSNDPNDVMFRGYNPDTFTPLTRRDINTMKTQYCPLFMRQ